MSTATKLAGTIAVLITFINVVSICEKINEVASGEKEYTRKEVIKFIGTSLGVALISVFFFALCCYSEQSRGD